MQLRNPLTRERADELYVLQTLAYYLVPVTCLSSDSIGDIVCIRDVLAPSGKWRVQKANPEIREYMPGIGILISKDSPTSGVMQRYGMISGLYTGLSITSPVFVGFNGRPTQILPDPAIPGSVFVQNFGRVVASDTLFLTGEFGNMIKHLK